MRTASDGSVTRAYLGNQPALLRLHCRDRLVLLELAIRRPSSPITSRPGAARDAHTLLWPFINALDIPLLGATGYYPLA